jgi:hypothetical protein
MTNDEGRRNAGEGAAGPSMTNGTRVQDSCNHVIRGFSTLPASTIVFY